MKGTALITAGAKRIGKTLALKLAELGYHIALHYCTSQEEALQLRQEILALGVECEVFSCDFNQIEKVPTFFQNIFKRFPNLNLLINNASIFDKLSFQDTNLSSLDRNLNINFKTPFFLSQSFAKFCQKGQIINILDTKVSNPSLEHFPYSLSKMALYELTKMTAKVLAPKIRVNGIGPGLILPPPGEDQEYLKHRSKAIPLQRIGSPEEIFAAIAYFLENPFITGQLLYIDGGEHL